MIDAMKLALEALNKNVGEFRIDGARQILRTAIKAAEKQEPVAWVNRGENRIERVDGWDGYGALYTTPPAAQPAQQEPVAWMYESVCGNDFATRHKPPDYAKHIRPLYTTPPAAQWVGLTDADKREFAAAQYSWEELCSAIEQALKEKNT
jgi:hypothetical protein